MNIQIIVGQLGDGVSYSYRVPDRLTGDAAPGTFVLIPFGRRIVPGVIVSILTEEPKENLKEVLSVLQDIPPLSETYLRFLLWLSEYYVSSPGKVFGVALPFFGRNLFNHYYRLNAEHPMHNDLDDIELRQISEFCDKSNSGTKLPAEYKPYEKLGLLRRMPYLAVQDKNKENQSKTKKTIARKPDAVESEEKRSGSKNAHVLTDEQLHALDHIKSALERHQFARFLLFGVTGSGKTEVYLRAAEECIKNGRSVLILVPEIGLTPQNIQFFSAYFKTDIFVRHSKIRKSVVISDWLKINEPAPKIVIGTRSAIFSPLHNIGLIIVDEEHDTSFKQQEPEPYYSARDAAVKLAEMYNAVYVSGSATPSVESYYNALNGKFKLLKLTQKVFGQKPDLPVILNPSEGFSENGIFYMHRELKQALKHNFENGKQSIIFINRRGYARLLLCSHCKRPVFCINCSIPYTYSRKYKRLECHHCFHHAPVSQACPSCGDKTLNFVGFGTERIETDIQHLFPKSRVMRIDSDTVKSETVWQTAIKKIKKHDVDFIIGTQMIAKGHDFPNIGLVVVMFPDLGLNFPDFRAAERVFQLLVQISGRTGRRKDQPGRTIVLSYNPSHTVIQQAVRVDYERFYNYIISIRQALNFPPYCRLALLVYDDDDEVRTYNAVIAIVELFRTKYPNLADSFMGPVESPLFKINNRFYWQWLLRQNSPGELVRLCRDIKNGVDECRLKGRFKILVDTVRG